MRRVVSLIAVLGLALGALACKEEGPMEKAGKAMDTAVEDATEAGKQALDEAGEKVDETAEKAKKMAEGEH